MATISHIVQKIVRDRPLLVEGLEQGIISFGNLAEQIKPKIEEELDKEVKHSAVVMALRRYAEKLQKPIKKQRFDYESEIIMKTNLCDIAVLKSPSLFAKLKKIPADYEKGDTLNIIHGNNEIAIITNEKFLDNVLKELKGEKILNKEINLVALSMSYPTAFLHTPGVLSTIVRKLAWENVNIFELISTMTELTFIINKKDAMKGYDALQRLISEV